MKQNTKTILLTIFACLVLITGFEIGSGRIRFGNAYFNDSTALYITSNKGLIVNGPLKTSDSLVLDDYQSIAWNGAIPTRIESYAGSMETYANDWRMRTVAGNKLIAADSIYGVGLKPAGMDAIGWGSEPKLRTKFIRGVAPTGNSTVTFAHGLTDNRIISADIWLRHDTTYTTAYHTARNWYVQPGATYDPTILYYAGFDSLYCWARFPAAATATRGDSLYFVLTYIDPL